MSVHAKTVAFEDLVREVESLRRDRKTVVHCHGVFDLLHIGHIRYFQSAKRQGDVLVVTITPDQFVNKGPHRPVFDQRLRTEAIASLDCVDFVAVNNWPTAVEALRRLRPDVYAKGAEFREQKTPELLQEEAEAATLGIRVEYVEDEVTASSSYLVNHFLSPFTDEVDRYLADARRKWKPGELAGALQGARDLRVVVVGEAILDEYVFCSTLGQSTKAPNVVGRFQAEERFLGEALAVANHLSAFCGQVQLLAMVGDEANAQQDIRARLRPEVQPHFVIHRGAPTTVKRQFREAYFATILFELDYLDDSPLAAPERAELDAWLQDTLPDADLVLVPDYGHGMLDEALIGLLCDRAPFLAVTTPASAANLGYHTISRYPRVDYFTLAEQDLRLDRRSRQGDVKPMLTELTEKLGAQQSLLTVGNKGCIGYSPADGFVAAPALAVRVVDRLGAGEAAFAATSVGAFLGLPLEQLAFLCNVAGAEAVSVMGNSRFLDALSFRRTVESLLR